MVIKNRFNIILFGFFLLISCKGETKKEINSYTKYNETTIHLKENENKVLVDKDTINMDSILNKLQRNIELTENEYRFFSNKVINNNDEAFSENIGYLMFQYFLNNKSYCNDFKVYLKKEKEKTKDKVLVVLLQSMCIDLADESYNYDRLINDFPFFKESPLIKKQLEECINNY